MKRKQLQLTVSDGDVSSEVGCRSDHVRLSYNGHLFITVIIEHFVVVVSFAVVDARTLHCASHHKHRCKKTFLRSFIAATFSRFSLNFYHENVSKNIQPETILCDIIVLLVCFFLNHLKQ